MPDFSAISSLLGAVKNVLEGVTGVTGSLTGTGVGTMLEFFDGGSSNAV